MTYTESASRFACAVPVGIPQDLACSRGGEQHFNWTPCYTRRLIRDSGWVCPAIPLLLYNPLSSAFRPHHLSACSLRIAKTRTMVNIRNLIDDVKCFQTVRDLHGPRG